MIQVRVDSNEQSHSRAAALRVAVEADPRFTWGGADELPLDVQFSQTDRSETVTEGNSTVTRKLPDNIWNVELKEGPDFIQSIMSGHLYEQMLGAREIGHPCAVLVIGSDYHLNNFIASDFRASTNTAWEEKRLSYINCWRDFEAQCFGLNVPVLCFSCRWPERLLSHAAHLFADSSNMVGHRPKSRQGERQEYALCALVDRLGPERARTLLREYGSIAGVVAAFTAPASSNWDKIPGVGPVLRERLFAAINFKVKK